MQLSEFAEATAKHRKQAGLALLLALFLIGLYCTLLLTYLGTATAYVLHHFSPSIAGAVQGSLMFPVIFIRQVTTAG